jgi:hypothetical protein
VVEEDEPIIVIMGNSGNAITGSYDGGFPELSPGSSHDIWSASAEHA